VRQAYKDSEEQLVHQEYRALRAPQVRKAKLEPLVYKAISEPQAQVEYRALRVLQVLVEYKATLEPQVPQVYRALRAPLVSRVKLEPLA
jgi:hypothetical protein